MLGNLRVSDVYSVQNTFHSNWWNLALESASLDSHLIANFPCLAAGCLEAASRTLGWLHSLCPFPRKSSTLECLRHLFTTGLCLLMWNKEVAHFWTWNEKGEITFLGASQHSCVVGSVTPLNQNAPALAEEMGQIIQGVNKVEETQNSYQYIHEDLVVKFPLHP